ncbi:MAG: helix-turn-helix domain-containing protein [Bacteroidota bacterium]|nr:helix-turn-helix domain-containing protein [Bacteroidota bacterium]
MSYPSVLIIKESLTALKSILKKSSPLIAPRIKVLIEMKKSGETGISKRELADLVGVNHNSVQTWRKVYHNGGIEALTTHNKIGFKPSVFTQAEHNRIEQKLNDPKNGLRGYVELLEWVESEFKKQVKYNTLLKYSIKNFGSKVKVARKSHVNKDEKAVAAFKKTSVKSVKKPVKSKGKSSKR